MGTPDKEHWPEGHRLATAIHFQFPECQKVPLTSIVTKSTTYGQQLLEDMLNWDPERRPTAQQAIKYPFFEQAKRSTANLMGPPAQAKRHVITTNAVPVDFLLHSTQFYQPLNAKDNHSLHNGSNSSYLGSQTHSVSNMNTINDILNNLHINNNVDEAAPSHVATLNKRKDLERQSSKEKINELLMFSTLNENKPEANKNNNIHKGFFLHQPTATFPDSGIGDEEQEAGKPNHIHQVPVVVHKWQEPPKRRLSNLSLIAKITPVNKWDLHDDGVDGGDEHEEDEQSILKRYSQTNEDEDELGRILG